MTLQEKQKQLMEDLQIIEDPYERLEYVVDRGKKHPKLDEKYYLDEFKVRGCISNLWLVPSFEDGICRFRVDSDSAIVKGIATILCELYSDFPPEEIIPCDPEFLRDVGITQHLSSNRRNALSHIWNRVKGFAEQCLAA